MKVMVLTDNEFIFNNFMELINQKQYSDVNFDFYYSESNRVFKKTYLNSNFKPIDIKQGVNEIILNYQLVISLHCKQIFPAELVNQVRCVNVHPGYNPYNRGWFPQVFSILNKLPIGVTIHEMDEQLDHGSIILQKKIDILLHETSYDVYKKIQDVEIELLRCHLRDIIDCNYEAKPLDIEGNLNLKKDFNKLREIELDKIVTFREAIDYFRAMSFTGYKNAYFYDEKGRKIFVNISLELEEVENSEKPDKRENSSNSLINARL